MELENKIEAILFFKGEPMSRKKLAETFSVEPAEIDEALLKLQASLAGRGIVLVEKDSSVTLGTAPEMSEIIENIRKEELNRELSKASLETLSIVLYKNEVGRAEIDFIRGVNSSFTLRALSVRGLIEKVSDPKDSRRFVYRPSFELLSYMGVRSVEELPEYKEVREQLEISVKDQDASTA